MNPSIIALSIALATCSLYGREYHVAITGQDGSRGVEAEPLRTISAAAEIALPGDTITVHAGVYREYVNPPRGGRSDSERIVYRAADGESVIIKGSEVIRGWQEQADGVWHVSIANHRFGAYNPYQDVLSGDWFTPQGRVHHTGEVYLNGKALFEDVSLEKVKARPWSWYCEVDDAETHLWAHFGASNPNQELTEINVRPACFYPDQPGRDFITVRGFTLRHGATQWAPPTAEQIALIGTHWSRGWIIEDNVISDSKCVGLTMGKYGDAHDNTSADRAGGYVETIQRALERGWSKEKVGSHLVRNNTIYNCGAAGICGSLGGAFSQVIGNHIYNINIDKPFTGHEMAGIKLHAPIDVIIQKNRIHHTSRGIWLDWMTQGTRVTANLLYDNGRQDLYIEVNHGPYTVDNNLFLTPVSLKDRSQGGAYSHNLFLGAIDAKPDGRRTPYHTEHSTEIAGMSPIYGGDNRFYNNLVAGNGLVDYAQMELPCSAEGNVYLGGADPLPGEENPVHAPEFNPGVEVVEEGGAVYLDIRLPEAVTTRQSTLVTTERLGRARVSGAPYVNPDGSPYAVVLDYFGKNRNQENPAAGPFEGPGPGGHRLKIWPGSP